MGALGGAVNLRELAPLAQRILTPNAWGYYSSGANDEKTVAENEAAFERWLLRPRVLVDVSSLSTEVSMLGVRLPTPIFVAPMAAQRLACDAGELATARAAQRAGNPLLLSTMSTVPLEEVAKTRQPGGPPQWFQLYVFRDRELTASLVCRAEAAGYSALVVTVDAPYLGRREADVRGSFSLPEGLTYANLGASRPKRAKVAGEADDSTLAQLFVAQMDASLSWADIGWLRSITRLPILVRSFPAEAGSAARKELRG